METHIPRLYKAVGLLFLGCVFLTAPSAPWLHGNVILALLAFSAGCFFFSLLEAILLFLTRYTDLYFQVTEAIQAASSLTPEMRQLMGFGIEKWSKPTHPDPSRVLINDDKGHQTILSLPLPPLQFKPFAQGLLNEIPFSEKQWVSDSKFMSSPQFRTIQDMFLKYGYATYRNQQHPKQGVVLTSVGKAAMRFVVQQEKLPTLSKL